MLIRAGKQIGVFVAVLLGTTILAFLLSQLSGVDPAEAYIRRTVMGPTQEQIDLARQEMGHDKLLPEQYIRWLSGCLHGDFGRSLLTRNNVGADMMKKLPVTLSIAGLSLLFTFLLAVPISILCVIRKNGMFDHAVRAFSILGISLPTFWLAFVFLLVFSSVIPGFKVVNPNGIGGSILPAITIAIPVAASMIRMLRANLLAEMKHDYIFYARTRGLSFNRVLWRHALPNALPSVITMFGQYLGAMIAGSAVVESIFSLRDIGTYLLEAIVAYDVSAINGCVVVIAFIFALCNTVTDAINTRMTPRIAPEGGEHG